MQGSLSKETIQLLEKLHTQPTNWRGRFRSNKTVSIIDQIGQSGEPLAVPSLLEFAVMKNSEISRAACLAIRSLISKLQPLDLAFLDQYMRQLSQWSYGRNRVAEINPELFLKHASSANTDAYTLGLASFHRDGYVREASTRALARVSSGHEVPFLLIRANDWVIQVREAANEALRARINDEHIAAFVRSLPLVARLRDSRRADHEALADSVEDLLGNGRADKELLAGLHCEDRVTRRACARIAIDYKKSRLCEIALSTSDLIVRLSSAKYLLAELPASAACALSAKLAGDSLKAIRLNALRVAVERCPEHLRDRLEAGLLDLSFSVRLLAGFHAEKSFGIDLAEFYRSRLQLSSGHSIAACILGLAEHGQKADAPQLVAYLSAGTSRIRRAAVRAIAALDFESHRDLLREAIRSELPGVSKEASLVLQRLDLSIDPTFLESLLLSDPYVHVRVNAFRVLENLNNLGKWSRLKYALIAVAAADEALVTRGSLAINHWTWSFNGSFAQPTLSEIEEISALLDSPFLQISTECVKELRGYLPEPA